MLFRRKRSEKTGDYSVKGRAAKGIANFLLTVQREFSECMNTSTKNVSAKNMKIALIVFCLFSGGFSIYLIAQAILRSDKEQPVLKIDQVDVPKHYDRIGDEDLHTEQYVDRESYERIESFERYMDSLQQTQQGSKVYDSIVIARPGLMDSVKLLKEIYQSQINK